MGTKSNPAPNDCYARALPDEPLFVLLARDLTAPSLIERWAELREAEIASGQLVEVLQEFAAPPNGIHAVFPQRKHLALRVRLWIDFLKEKYGQSGFWQRDGG